MRVVGSFKDGLLNHESRADIDGYLRYPVQGMFEGRVRCFRINIKKVLRGVS